MAIILALLLLASWRYRRQIARAFFRFAHWATGGTTRPLLLLHDAAAKKDVVVAEYPDEALSARARRWASGNRDAAIELMPVDLRAYEGRGLEDLQAELRRAIDVELKAKAAEVRRLIEEDKMEL